jgi:D-beta-D-heptose 7-phosphate kinase/D-beta-D-heptose 1-phosphate adenosyltransferase
MLDQLTFGNADRLSPEAPVPVLHVQRTEHRPGGAANVCLDLLAMRAAVHAIGVTGDDREGDLLRSALVAAGVEADALVADASRPTTVKQSLIGLAQHRHQHKMFRLDFESREPIAPEITRRLLDRFLSLLPKADIVLIEDYNKGVCTPALCAEVIGACRARGIEVLVDPASIKDYSRYRGATTITPNRSETTAAAQLSIPHDAAPAAYEPASRKLQRELDLDAVVVKLDRHGALLLEPSPSGRGAFVAQHVPTVARDVYDVTGAGDMVLAALAAARANKLPWFEAARFANIAAGLEVQVFGVAPIPLAEIHRECLRMEAGGAGLTSKVRTLDQLLVEVAAARHAGKTIIFTNGCFDILHAGHLSLLRRAADQADAHGKSGGPHGFLIVAANSDDSVRRLKGRKDPSRPINNENDRAELLGGLECVNAVVLFDDDTPERLIRAVKPDVLVKGDEYTIDQVPGAKFVQESGGRVVLLPMLSGKSTTNIVTKMRQP